jgi:hypothetical protein
VESFEDRLFVDVVLELVQDLLEVCALGGCWIIGSRDVDGERNLFFDRMFTSSGCRHLARVGRQPFRERLIDRNA